LSALRRVAEAEDRSEVRALPQPDEGRATLDRYYSEYARGIAQVKSNPRLVVGTAIPPAFNNADQLARAYGITGCVR
jgi:hypothetical protein